MNFNSKKIIGMIHVPALPGTPNYKGSVKKILETALKEASIYAECGVDSIMIENMHDVPYLKRNVGEEVSILMAIIAYEVKRVANLPVGIQILAGANKAALSAAHSAQIDYIRAEGFVFGHFADEGLFDSDAGELLRYRKQIGAEQIKIFTDIKKKHSSHQITADISLAETAVAAEFFLSDAVIVTGSSTGSEANIDEVIAVKNSVKIPVLVGSGITDKNAAKFYEAADGLIIGSYFKKGGNWKNGVDKRRVNKLLSLIR